MTRDEAIEKFRYAANEGSFAVEAWIDRFAALGMIKLDDPPKSIESRLVAIFGPHATWNFREFENGLRAHGLKIVEA